MTHEVQFTVTSSKIFLSRSKTGKDEFQDIFWLLLVNMTCKYLFANLRRCHSITVRASAFESDYVLMDPGSNPCQVTFFIYLKGNLINEKLFDVDFSLTMMNAKKLLPQHWRLLFYHMGYGFKPLCGPTIGLSNLKKN